MDTISNRPGPTHKKHCMTRGLIEQLKARASLKHAPPLNSPLSILVWESPLLAESFRITFLVRLETDGEEALGFRFDNTTDSRAPRQIAWGGMVGTSDSPRCFLDGSQTFLTESASKASERCRAGWHVRIGKVSQIINLFDETEKSLAMKLSLRKLDSSTHIVNLLSQSQSPSSFETYLNNSLQRSHSWLGASPMFHISSSNKQLPSHVKQEARTRVNPLPSLSKTVTLTRAKTHHEPINKPSSVQSPPSTPSIITSPSLRRDTQLTSVHSPKIVSPAVPLLSHKDPFRQAALFLSAPQRVNKGISSPVLTSSPGCSVPLPVNNPIRPLIDYLDNGTKHKPMLPITHSTNVNQSLTISVPDLSTPSITSEKDSDSYKSSIPSAQTIITSEIPTASDPLMLLPLDVPESAKEVVCFVFPPNPKRPIERKLYVAYCDLIKVDYFRQALEAATPTLSIDEKPTKRFGIFQTLKKMFRTLDQIVHNEVSALLRSFLPDKLFGLVGRKRNAVSQFVVALSNVGLGLAFLAWNTSLEAMRLIFHEFHSILDTLIPQDSMGIREAGTTLWMGALISLGSFSKTICQSGLMILRYFTQVRSSYDEDSDEEPETWLENDDVEPSSFQPTATFTINHIAYPTFRALAEYLQHGIIRFLPLPSVFEAHRRLAKELSQDNLTAPLVLGFPFDRQDYFKSHSVNVAKNGCSKTDLKLTPCNPKSVYALAHKLQLPDLQEHAHQQIIRGLSPLNVARELRAASIYDYKELIQDYHKIVKSTLGIPESSVCHTDLAYPD